MSHRVTRISGYGAISAHEPLHVYIRHTSQVDVYSTHTNTLMRSFTGLSVGAATDISPYPGIEISPDNRFFLTNGTNGTGVYSTLDGSQLYFLSNTNPCRPAISKNGAYIALAEGSVGTNTRIIETSGWTTHTTFDPTMASGEVYTWSHDGTKLAIGDALNNVKIIETSGWTAYSNTVALSDQIRRLSFSPDDTLIACAQNSSSVALNVMTVSATLVSGSATTKDVGGRSGRDLQFTGDGKLLYVITDESTSGDIEAFNVSGWTSYAAVLGSVYTGNGTSLSVSSGGGQVAIGSAGGSPGAFVFDDKLKLIATYSTGTAIGGIAFENPR